MPRIKIDPQQVRSVASTFKQKSVESQTMISQLENQINSMQPEWEGMSSQKFYADFQQWRTSMKQFTKLLDDIGLQLEQIATRLASADGQQ